MKKFEVIGDGRRPPVWRTILLAVFTCFFSLLSSAFSRASWAMARDDEPFMPVLVLAAALLLSGVLPVLLFWRHRWPFALVIGAALLAVVFPLGNVAAYVLLASLIGRRRGLAVWWTTALVAVTSTWVVVADALAQPRGASVLKGAFGPSGADAGDLVAAEPWTVLAVIVGGLGLSIGAGLVMRSLREAAAAKGTATKERAASDRLGDEAARRQERERIAREVHDAMGHRLSLLNLHAGAMEANADDPRMAESAKLVRESAAAAMSDLRSLLAVLRDPMTADTADLPLARLADVVGESFGAGQPLSSSIFISDPERADPALSRAVYRIVQELLTNARKHAPGEQAFLTVEGGPATGIMIDARNNYRGGWGASGEPGRTRGLTGITERAELLGGTMSYGLDDGGATFRVRVELPWRERPEG